MPPVDLRPCALADVPIWARHATLKALRCPCALPRAQAWQDRIDDLADALTPKES